MLSEAPIELESVLEIRFFSTKNVFFDEFLVNFRGRNIFDLQILCSTLY